VPRWQSPLTPALFITIALGGGALLAGQVTAAMALLALAGLVQLIWWRRGDRALAESATDIASATGLGRIGTVRSFAPPHTGTNYLLREMVHEVGRKHAARLRVIALALGYAVPVVLLALPFGHALAALAVVSHLAGIAASRWLFFAEAEHVVGLYYGKR
jgi:DMSO reductase anchor subunit